MAHNVLSYGSPEAARRANRAINKVAQDGGFVGVKPTERRVHTAVASQTAATSSSEYNGYFKIVDITEYYDEDGKEISKPEYKIRICDGEKPEDKLAGICRINAHNHYVDSGDVSLYGLQDNVFVWLVIEETDSVYTSYFTCEKNPSQLGYIINNYLLGDVEVIDGRLKITQRHGVTGFSSNGVVNLLQFARFRCNTSSCEGSTSSNG